MTTQTGFAEVNGTRLYYEVAGTGHPLVLVHSLLFDHRVWDEVFPALAAHYQVVRYDMRGFGRSAQNDLGASDIEDLDELLRFLGIDRLYVMGLSIGAEVAQSFTLAHAEKVDALIDVASGTLGWTSTEAFDQRWGEFQTAAYTGDHAQARAIFSEMWVDGPIRPAAPAVRERAQAIMRDYSFAHYARPPAAAEAAADPPDTEAADAPGTPAEPSYEERLAHLKVPTLIIAGDRDQAGVRASADALYATIPGAQQVIIPNAAHIIPLEQPEALIAAVRAFLDALPAPGTPR